MNHAEAPENSVTNSKAIASLILGILSIFFVFVHIIGLALSIVSFILGIIAMKETKKLKQEGRNLAIAGIVCSSISIVSPIFFFIIGFLVVMGFDIPII